MKGSCALLTAAAALVAACAKPPPRVATREDAIAAVLAARPGLRSVLATSLPPSGVETAQAPGGPWRVGVVTRGSGVPWILRAECFSVSPAGAVTAVGVYPRPADRPGERRLRLDDCTPAP